MRQARALQQQQQQPLLPRQQRQQQRPQRRLRPAQPQRSQEPVLLKRSDDINNRFSSFGLNEGEVQGKYRPAAQFPGYKESERVGYRHQNIPLQFLASSFKLLSYLVSIRACKLSKFIVPQTLAMR